MKQTAKPENGKFVPTRAMIEAAEDVFLALAIEGTMRPIVQAYQRKVLAERKWLVAPEMQAVAGVEEYVTDIKYAWMMSKEDFTVYHQRCNEERIAAKLPAETDDHCPLLVAENATRLAKCVLLDAMISITKIDSKAASMSLENRDELVDLTLRLLAPFVKNILAEHPQ